MEFYVDIADLDAIEEVASFIPVEGFTTNPRILAGADGDPQELMGALRAYVERTGCRVFAQVTARDAEGMVEEARRLRAFFGETFVVKIPAVREGFRAVPMCKAEGICVCVTVVHSALQALVAAKAGADYVAPYVSHIESIGADGVACVAEMVGLFREHGYPTKVLGASFRTVDQVRLVADAGCQAVTLKPQMFKDLIAHPSTDESMRSFESAWADAFGEKGVCDLLP